LIVSNTKKNRFHPDLGDSLIPRQKQGYYIKKIPCCLLLMDEKDQRILKLNDTGVLLWQLCTGELNVGDILAMLGESYPENEDVISRDVYRVLDTFKEYEVIELADST
jgi:hypothetical protein